MPQRRWRCKSPWAAPVLLEAQDRFSAVAPRMQEFVDKGEVAGVVTLVATKERILHVGEVGKSDAVGHLGVFTQMLRSIRR